MSYIKDESLSIALESLGPIDEDSLQDPSTPESIGDFARIGAQAIDNSPVDMAAAADDGRHMTEEQAEQAARELEETLYSEDQLASAEESYRLLEYVDRGGIALESNQYNASQLDWVKSQIQQQGGVSRSIYDDMVNIDLGLEAYLPPRDSFSEEPSTDNLMASLEAIEAKKGALALLGAVAGFGILYKLIQWLRTKFAKEAKPVAEAVVKKAETVVKETTTMVTNVKKVDSLSNSDVKKQFVDSYFEAHHIEKPKSVDKFDDVVKAVQDSKINNAPAGKINKAVALCASDPQKTKIAKEQMHLAIATIGRSLNDLVARVNNMEKALNNNDSQASAFKGKAKLGNDLNIAKSVATKLNEAIPLNDQSIKLDISALDNVKVVSNIKEMMLPLLSSDKQVRASDLDTLNKRLISIQEKIKKAKGNELNGGVKENILKQAGEIEKNVKALTALATMALATAKASAITCKAFEDVPGAVNSLSESIFKAVKQGDTKPSQDNEE